MARILDQTHSNNRHQAWAKLADGAALPLSDHGGDVAAVLKALFDLTLWRERLEVAAGRPLSGQDIARLCALAYLHDLGKANRGFWQRQFEGAPRVGHTAVTAALFDLAEARPVKVLDGLIARWGADQLFCAVMAHHGEPLQTLCPPADERGRGEITDRIKRDRTHWEPGEDYDPMVELQRLLDDAQARFPEAFSEGPPLPDTPRFVALCGGLMTLADWLGSDQTFFPIEGPHGEARHTLQAERARHAVEVKGLAVRDTPEVEFEAAFGFSPLGAQLQAHRIDVGQVALIEAETGSGKTEAALWRWLGLRAAGLVDGLYFALPTRSAAVQLHGRVQTALDRVFGPKAIEAVLAVPGYLRAGDAEGQALPGFEVTWPDEPRRDDRWAAEKPKRFLSARVAVGTVDQAMLAGLKVRHAHLRAASLARSLLVVDEVHASDAFMTEVLQALIANHAAWGGHVLLLSATLAGEARAGLLGTTAPKLEQAITTPYPALSGTRGEPVATQSRGSDKRVHWQPLPLIDDARAIAVRAAEAARMGASVLVVRNSVVGAIAVARALEAVAPELAFRVNSVATLHHGRFSPDDRRLLDAAVEREFGKNRGTKGRVLVGTQTLEQSLDIDADYLITDLAPIDVLLQRIGRLHRHERGNRGAFNAACTDILIPAERDLTPLLRPVRSDRHGLGPMADGRGVYPNLLMIEATLRLIETNLEIALPRDNRRLVEGALHSTVLEELAEELGTEWINHAAQQSGGRMADRGVAEHWRLDMAAPFDSLLFPEDEKLRTRLGGSDRIVDFDEAVPGPFGKPVSRLVIPGWMAVRIPVDAEPEVKIGEGEFTFSLAQKRFHYSRFGLEKLA